MDHKATHDGGSTARGRRHSIGIGLAAAVLIAAVSACEVTNPGPVHDEFLFDEESHEGLVRGAERMLVESVNYLAYTGALPAREIFPGGQTGAHGHSARIQGGALPYDEVDTHWDNAQQARYIAENAIERFTSEEVEADDVHLAQAYIWAGYANRLLGENMCQAVFDGEAAQDNIEYFRRAEAHFDSALAYATGEDQRNAAHAGRAQVRVWLDDWAGASQDAAEVPESYELTINASDVDTDTRNRVYWANADSPYRAYTIHHTFYYDYYADTGDPRTPWMEDPEVPVANASLSGYGQVSWSNQLKYDNPSADYRLASGREMRLIEAEAMLSGEGTWQAALQKINAVRTSIVSDETGDPLEPRTASNAADTWTHLMRERGIELWLEARRLGDLRRWSEDDVPGDVNLADFESISDLFSQEPRAQCFPISETERDANPNIPTSPNG